MQPAAIILSVVILAAIVVIAFIWSKRKQSQRLRENFGPEYDRAVRAAGDPVRAEKELETRQKRVESFKLRPLSVEDRNRFVVRWQGIQALFVDEPSRAVQEANQMVKDVMQARGYPVGDFQQRAADLSVHYPKLIENYRLAKDCADRNARGQTNTEELRKALVYYRDLFEELLESRETKQEKRELQEAIK